MAGVEQTTAPGAAVPDETQEAAGTRANHAADHGDGRGSTGARGEPTTRAGRRAARRRASQDAGQKADAAEPGPKPSRHTTDGTAADRPSVKHAASDTDTETDSADRPLVSLIKVDRSPRPPAPTVGRELVPAHAPRPAGPARSNAPIYRPRHAKRRRRWPTLLAAGLVLVTLAGVGAAVLIGRQNDDTDRATAPAATNIAPAPADLPTQATGLPSVAAPAPGTQGAGGAAGAAAPGTADCRFNPASDKTPRILPPARATRSGLVKATIGTSGGPVTLELDATNAPCTVESFLTLAAGGYYNDTACHRLTTLLIFVLQCGDPTALGSGDPGYSFDDENLPAPGGTPYPRGTLAMANAGPDTNGSQFFIVYKDSPIDPNYPVFGKVTGGLEIVERVAAGGAPGNDGQPNESIVIQAVQIN